MFEDAATRSGTHVGTSLSAMARAKPRRSEYRRADRGACDGGKASRWRSCSLRHRTRRAHHGDLSLHTELIPFCFLGCSQDKETQSPQMPSMRSTWGVRQETGELERGRRKALQVRGDDVGFGPDGVGLSRLDFGVPAEYGNGATVAQVPENYREQPSGQARAASCTMDSAAALTTCATDRSHQGRDHRSRGRFGSRPTDRSRWQSRQ